MSFPIKLPTAAVLLIAALTVCLAGVKSRANPLPHAPAYVTQNDGVRRITPAELKEAQSKGAVVLIDVRSEPVYKTGHIKGALSIPLDEFTARLKELPRDKMIVTYCS